MLFGGVSRTETQFSGYFGAGRRESSFFDGIPDESQNLFLARSQLNHDGIPF
jgi:hypothetical protein